MPTINMPLDLLLRLVNADRPVLEEQRVEQIFRDMGVEVAELTRTRVYACSVCENVLERTEAQGVPLTCPRCAADFRARPDACRALGENKVARLEMLAVRPDIFDPGGMARCLRAFLGVRTGLTEYPVAMPRLGVRVDPRLSEASSFRPWLACAVLRGLRLDHERIRMIINMQEDLHWALGRDRKLASIGMYDLDTLQGANFRYDAVAPNELRFVPLGFPPDRDESRLTPAEIVARHPTGKAYAHLLRGFSAYPLLRDEHGTVLSMPPIINSESTRVTTRTRSCFVDVTGLARRTVDRALAIIVTGLREAMPEVQIEAVIIDGPDGRRTTPDLAPASMWLDPRTASDTIGVSLGARDVAGLLERMGHAATTEAAGSLVVRVPAWRNDVMHPIDLIEDAAVAYGYDNLPSRLVPTFTIGTPREIEELSAVVRRVFTGLGFHQVLTLTLTNEAAAFDRWRVPREGPPAAHAVRIENPISSEQTICRLSLLPGLLETLSINKRYDLPQSIFEVGDVSRVDPDAETGAREERLAAAALIGAHVGYADVRAVCDALSHELSVRADVSPLAHPSFIPGRAAALRDPGGRELGRMGEVHPEVLESYGLKHAVAVLEVSLPMLVGLPSQAGSGTVG
jgi:phenylalanyl-tRNA synthetase beta chain